MKSYKQLVTVMLIAAIFCTAFSIGPAQATQPSIPSPHTLAEGSYVPGQLLVGMADPVPLSRGASSIQLPGVDILSVTDLTDVTDILPPSTNASRSGTSSAEPGYQGRQILLLELASDDLGDMLAAIDILEQNPLVAYAEPNLIGSACALPDDPYFQTGDLWGMEKIQAPEAWDIETGSHDVMVGVMDTGMYYEIDPYTGDYVLHPDLEGNVDISLGRNFCPREDSYEPQDDYGHGTHVAGTIGAKGNNATGVVGVCWDITIIPLKIWRNGYGSEAELISALAYSESIEIPILNLSGRWYPSWGVDMQAMHDAIESYSGLLVCAAGNEGGDNDDLPNAAYPASFVDCENIISVAASYHDDELVGSDGYWYWSSNYGETSVDLAAPGEDVLSTVPLWYGYEYEAWGGTSMASPHVASAAGLLKSCYPELTTAQLKARILDNVDYSVSLDGKVLTNGRLNVYKALTATVDPPGDVAITQVSGYWALDDAGFVWDISDVNAPVQVNGLSNVVEISGSGSYVMALISDGTVWEFDNNYGSPGIVMGLSDITTISVGEFVWMALDNSGVLYYNGTAIGSSMSNGNNIVMISAGANVGVVIDDTNQLYLCYKRFGVFLAEDINLGQPVTTAVAPVTPSSDKIGVAALDDGTISVFVEAAYIEGTVQGPQGIVAIDMRGLDFVLMLDQGGIVWEWDMDFNTTPQQVSYLSGAVSISAGGGISECFSAAVLDDGTLWVWGGQNQLALQQVIFPS